MTIAAAPARLDRARRDVHRDDVVAALLEMERDAPSTGADVEHATAHVAHALTVVSRPAAKRCEV
jgi:hypothetical protein